MGDDRIDVVVGATTGELKTGMDETAAKVQQTTASMQSAFENNTAGISTSVQQMTQQINTGLTDVTSTLAKVSGAFAVLTGLLGGGALFKGAVDEFVNLNLEAKKLSSQMGSSTQDAAALITAYNRIGVSTDTVSQALRMLERNIKTNGDAVVDMGRQVGVEINLNDDLTTTYFKVTEALGKYEEGHQRNQAALNGFGARVQNINSLLRVNQEDVAAANEHLQKLGLTLDDVSVNKARNFQAGMHDVGLEFDAMKYKIGEVAIPALTSLGKAVIWVTERFREMMTAQTSAEGAIGEAWGAGPSERKLSYFPPPAEKPKSGAAYTDPKTGGGGGGGGASLLQQWKDELEQLKVEQDRFLDYSKQEEKAFWESKLAQCQAGSKEYLAVRHEMYALDKALAQEAVQTQMAEMDKAIARDKTNWDQKKALMAQELVLVKTSYGDQSREYQRVLEKQKDLDKSYEKYQEDLAVARLDNNLKVAQQELEGKRATLQFEREMGQISAQAESQALIALKQFELKLEQETINKKRQIRQGDEKAMEQLDQQEAVFHQKKLNEMTKAEQDAALKNKQTIQSIMAPIQGAIDTSITGIIQGTTTVSKAIDNLLMSILSSFTGFFGKLLQDWVANQLEMLIFGKTTAESQIATDAGRGGAAAAMSVFEAVPFPANVALAPEVGAAAAALIAGFGVASAAGGWDVPADSLSFVHKKEMILPAELSERIRAMTAPAAPGGGGEVHNHYHSWQVQAVDAQSVKKLFMAHGEILAHAVNRVFDRHGKAILGTAYK